MDIKTITRNLVLTFIGYCIARGAFHHYVGARRRYYPASTFPHLEILRANFATIEEELFKADWYLWPERHLWDKPGDRWNICPLFGFDIWHQKNLEKFPKTSALLKQIPGLRTAIFSRLGPGTRLNRHQGWAKLANKVLRCHMGMYVPQDGASGVEVEGERCLIKHGEWIVFDDSKYHLGFNESRTQDRVVLLLDIERPWWVRKGESLYQDMSKLDSFLQQIQLE